MKCSHCGREFEPAEDRKFCSFCGGKLESRPGSDPDLGDADFVHDDIGHLDSPGYCPWEDQETLGFLQGLTMTLRESLFAPGRFFSRMPVEGGLANPLLYSVIVSTTANLLLLVTALMVGNPLLTKAGLTGSMVIVVALLIPIAIMLGLVVWSGLLHLSLSVVGGARRDYEGTFRVVCYSSGPDLFKAIPYIGQTIALVWWAYLTVVGLREVHRISTGWAVLAFALPSMMCCGGIIGIVLLVAAMMQFS